jgi:hypothetical protein
MAVILTEVAYMSDIRDEFSLIELNVPWCSPSPLEAYVCTRVRVILIKDILYEYVQNKFDDVRAVNFYV